MEKEITTHLFEGIVRYSIPESLMPDFLNYYNVYHQDGEVLEKWFYQLSHNDKGRIIRLKLNENHGPLYLPLD